MGCELPTLKNFLFCLTLETGGLVLGWLTAIFAAIGVISLAATLIVALVGTATTGGALAGNVRPFEAAFLKLCGRKTLEGF